MNNKKMYITTLLCLLKNSLLLDLKDIVIFCSRNIYVRYMSIFITKYIRQLSNYIKYMSNKMLYIT